MCNLCEATKRVQDALEEFLQFECDETGARLTESKAKVGMQLAGEHLAELFEYSQVGLNYRKLEGN